MGDIKFTWIKIFSALFFVAVVSSQSSSWDEPYYIDANSKGIGFLSDDVGTNLYVDEELNSTVLVILNYNGDDPPVMTYQDNFNVYFEPKLEKRSDNWVITIEHSTDFERNDLSNYLFSPIITLNGKKHQDLFVYLINLDDNPPEIIVDTAKCSVTEEQSSADMTQCIYTVRDPDGCSNVVSFEVENQEEIFELVLDGESAEWPACLQVWKPRPITQSKYHLYVKKELDFETTRNYFLTVNVEDGSGQVGSNELVVNVDDIPDTAPQWMTSFSTVTVPEKEPQEFQVVAKDGDTAIDADICYSLTVEDDGISSEEEDYFSILEDSGNVTIGAIDRDKYQRNTYNLQILAFECNDPSSATPTSISVVVKDKNDNSPIICAQASGNGNPRSDCLDKEIEISLEEGKPATLNSFYIIGITDPDEGTAGTFNVALVDAEENSEQWSEAFSVIPNQGYQDGKFTVSVSDPSKLDYEIEAWRNITLKLVATEVADNTHIDEIPIIINLINVNDESPEFETDDGDTLQVTVKENLPANEKFYTVHATDADGIEDVLTYGLVQAKGLSIDSSTGDITTNKENVFDYELQQQVIVQVVAQDSMGSESGGNIHKTFTTLTITVEDVNDVAPQIALGVNAIDVDESLEPGNALPDATIVGTDVDTNSSLKFSIDWSKTTGKKNSVDAAPEIFENCYDIVGNYSEDGDFIATLLAAKKLSWNDIDTIKLFIIVEDEYTEEGYESTDDAVLTINILDVNDHKPVFTSCEKDLQVTENSDSNVRIINGLITAEDEDGPDNNKIVYSIEPADSHIVIDAGSGQLYTGDVPIDRDCDGCEALRYTVTALNEGGPDGGTATCDILINVIDVNDNWPLVDEIEEQTVNINEDAESGVHITNITSHDIDVTPEYNTITYSIDTSSNRNLNNFFYIINHGEGIGELIVQLNGVNFDYDEGDKFYDVPIIITDGQQKSNTTPTIRVNIQDVNDNDPIFDDSGSAANDPKDCFFSVTEEKKANDRLMEEETIQAVDIDSGKNGQLVYNLISVKCVPNTNYECMSDDDALKLFDVKTTTEYRAYVTAKRDLLTRFGDYILEINAVDKGDEPRTSKSRFYRGCIADVNDNAPTITYPDVDYLIIRDGNGGITLSDGSDIPLFHADDKDYGSNAIVTFEFDNDYGLFRFEHTNMQNSFKFSLKDGVTFNDLDNYYSLNIQACDSGDPQQCSPKRKLDIYKMNTNPLEPIWDNDVREQEYQFTEGPIDDPMNLAEIPKATDPNNIELPGDPNDPDRPLEPIYYYLIRGSDNFTDYFKINSETGDISLIQPLDCTFRTNWELKVQASNAANQANLPVNPLEKSLFTVKISVRDINDKSPKFTEETYLASVSSNNEQFLTIEAIDPDLGDSVIYAIDKQTLENHVINGQIDVQKVFDINSKTGALTFQSSIDASVSGYLSFNVTATDKVGHPDSCFIKVYIISDKFKVPFTFQNTREVIVEHQNDITDILEIYFEHRCVVGKIESANTTEVATNMIVHFVNPDDSPVDSDDIKKYKNNATSMKALTDELYRKYDIVLKDFAEPTPTEDVDDSSLIRTVLIAVCAVMGFLLLSMLALYIIKTRNLRKLIGNLTKATAQQEDKQNFVLPNTNQYIDVGSNPVFNAEINTQQLDNASVSSADSSLIGIEDNPEFEAFYNNIVLKSQGGEDDDILKENPQLKAFVGSNHDDVNF